AGGTFDFSPGLFQWLAGRIDGGAAGLTNRGTITLAGPSEMDLFGTLNNVGTMIHAGIGNLAIQIGATLTNQPGAGYELQADQSVTGGGTFINRGTLRKSGGAGTSSMSPHVFRNEGAAINVQQGILALDFFSGSATGGTFTVAPDAVLDLSSQGTPVY